MKIFPLHPPGAPGPRGPFTPPDKPRRPPTLPRPFEGSRPRGPAKFQPPRRPAPLAGLPPAFRIR